MSLKEQGGEELQAAELHSRLEEAESRLDEQRRLIARHDAMLRRLEAFRSSSRRRERNAGTPCAHCDDGVLSTEDQRLVCSNCSYVAYL